MEPMWVWAVPAAQGQGDGAGSNRLIGQIKEL